MNSAMRVGIRRHPLASVPKWRTAQSGRMSRSKNPLRRQRRRAARHNQKRGHMRKVTLSKEHFDTFLFPTLARSNAKTDAEREIAIRVMRKVKEPALTNDKPLNARDLERRAEGEDVFEFKELIEESAVFVFEEDECNFIKKRLKDAGTQIALLVLDDYTQMEDLFKNAEKYEAKQPASTE